MAEFLASLEPDEPIPVLLGIPGASIHNLMEDFMHDGPLGIIQDVNGSLLFELASEGAFGLAPDAGGWIAKLDFQLYDGFRMFEDWMRAEGKRCSQNPFRVLNLEMVKKTDWPCLKGKAKNSMVVLEWLATVSALFVGTAHCNMRNDVAQAFNNICKLVEQTKFPRWQLSESQLRSMEINRQMALLGLHALCKACGRMDVYRFRLRPKFHRFDHGLRRCVRTRVSPSVNWSFSPEDMMGLCARMCNKIHGSSISKRAVQRWMLFFFCELEDSDCEQ